MPLDPGVVGIVGGAVGAGVGGLFALLGVRLQHTWGGDDTRSQRVEERANEAAHAILDELDKLRVRLHGEVTYDTDRLNNEALYDICHRIQRQAILIPGKDLRARVEMITTSIWNLEAVAVGSQQYLQQVSSILYRAGEEAMGAFLRGEQIPAIEDPPFQKQLQEYHREALERERQIEWEMAALEEDRRNRKGAT